MTWIADDSDHDDRRQGLPASNLPANSDSAHPAARVGYGGWTFASLVELIERLVTLQLPHGSVMLEAVENNGFLGRARVLELSGRSRSEKLTGWIRPMHRVMATLKADGALARDAMDPLVPMYDQAAFRPALYGYSVPSPLVQLLRTGGS
jgi:hypothetical protein